jgi:hypothetical protein
VADEGAETAKWAAAAGETATESLVPVIGEPLVSVAVIVRFPAVFKMALNVPVPLDSVLFAGNVALPSLLVK